MSNGIVIKVKTGISKVMLIFLAVFLFFSTFSIAGTQTTLTVCVFLWIILVLMRGAPPFQRTALDLPFLLFLVASLLSVAFSSKRLESFINLKNLVLISIVYIFAYFLTNRKLGRRLFMVLLVSGTASAVYGIVEFILFKVSNIHERTSGSFSNAMTFGGVMLFLVSLFVAVWIGSLEARKGRVVIFVGVIATAAAVLCSFTRSSWLGVFVSVILILWILKPNRLPHFVVGLLLLVLLGPAQLRERISTIWDLNFRTNVKRIQIFKGGLRIFKEHPIVGAGQMDLSELYERHRPPDADYITGHMHNNFIHVAASMGIVGLAAFCFLLVSFFRVLLKNLRLDLPPPERAWVAGSLGALTGFLVNGLFEWNFGDAEVVMMLYVIVGSNLAIYLHRDGFEAGNERVA